MTMPIGSRIIAISHSKDGVVHSYGKGTYIGNRRPPDGTRTMMGVVGPDFPKDFTNPCIVLDSGGIVWGCQCWWGGIEATEKRFEEYRWESVPPPVLEEISDDAQ